MVKELQKIIRMTDERAMLDAKVNGTYVVYKDEEGKMIREYADGRNKNKPSFLLYFNLNRLRPGYL